MHGMQAHIFYTRKIATILILRVTWIFSREDPSYTNKCAPLNKPYIWVCINPLLIPVTALHKNDIIKQTLIKIL